MTVHLFDGNNVMIRALTDFNPHNREALDLRFRYHSTTADQIWCWDGARHNERRRQIYPIYKQNRTPLGQDIYAHIRLWRELLEVSPATQIEVAEWEADDVIATFARKLAARGTSVVIHSNDEDYVQLTHDPRITINGVRAPKTPGRWIPLYKACVGDTSDNIKGIPGFGKKTWEQLDGHYEWLEAAIDGGSPHAFETLPLPTRVKTWLTDVENVELVQSMLNIIRFYTVPDKELESGITVGKPDPKKADDLLKKYIL